MQPVDMASPFMQRVLQLTGGKRIFLIGGRKDDARKANVESLLQAEVDWVDQKRPLSMKKMERKMSGANLVLVLTDCISHTNSENAARAAQKLGVPSIVLKRAVNELRLLEAIHGYISATTPTEMKKMFNGKSNGAVVTPNGSITQLPPAVNGAAAPKDAVPEDVLDSMLALLPLDARKARDVVRALARAGFTPEKEVPSYAVRKQIANQVKCVPDYVRMTALRLQAEHNKTQAQPETTPASAPTAAAETETSTLDPGQVNLVLDLTRTGSVGDSELWQEFTLQERINLLSRSVRILEQLI